ncbi:MAG TPA: hypothetical protein VGL34_25260 [Steroidobacteraceae bacterium]|jgi:hypothetical protein
MKKYQFTGHLSPLPPGIRLGLQISGEVYLVGEVEGELKSRDAAHAKQVAELNERIRKLTTRTMRFRQRKVTARTSEAKLGG